MTPILILAAGASSRMRGTDKLAQPVDGVPLLTRQIKRAEALQEQVFVALPASHHPRCRLLADTSAKPIFVRDASEGIGATLRGAIPQLPPSEAFMIVLPDLVQLTSADLQKVKDASVAHPDYMIWRGTSAQGKMGHPIICKAALKPAFADLVGDKGAQDILQLYSAATFLVPLPAENALRDLDTPEDWAAYMKENPA